MSSIDFSTMGSFARQWMDVTSSTDSMPSQTDSDRSDTPEVITSNIQALNKFNFLNRALTDLDPLKILNDLPIGRDSADHLNDDFDAPFTSIEILLEEPDNSIFFIKNLSKTSQERCYKILTVLSEERLKTLEELRITKEGIQKFDKDYDIAIHKSEIDYSNKLLITLKKRIGLLKTQLAQKFSVTLRSQIETLTSEEHSLKQLVRRANSILITKINTKKGLLEDLNNLKKYLNNIEINLTNTLLFMDRFPNGSSLLREAFTMMVDQGEASEYFVKQVVRAYNNLSLNTKITKLINSFKTAISNTATLIENDSKEALSKLTLAARELEAIYRHDPKFVITEENFRKLILKFESLTLHPKWPKETIDDRWKITCTHLFYPFLGKK